MEPGLPTCASTQFKGARENFQQLSARQWTPNRSLIPLIFLLLSITFFNTSLRAQDVLVGLTSNGGPEGKGTAYSIKTNGSGFSLIKGFADWGTLPVSDLVRGTDGNLYGMASEGGTYNHGTIFKMTPGGTITILKN